MQQVIKALLAGKRLATAHKEGATHVYFDGQAFRRSDYGEWTTEQRFADSPAVLAFLRGFLDWEAKRDLHTDQPSEAQVWAHILRRLQK